MRIVDVLGSFLVGALVLAGLSVVVRPGSQAGQILGNFGEATSNVIKAAKG